MSGRGWADRLLDRALPKGPNGESIRGDLVQERDRRAEREGAPSANRWYARQAISIWLFSTRDRLLGHEWSSSRAVRGGRATGGLATDLRDGLRVIKRAPGYSTAVVLTLGVAMAATVSVFTVVRGVLLRDLPYPEPHQLIRIDGLQEGVPGEGGIDFPTFRDWHERVGSFASLAAFQGSEGVYVDAGIAEVWRGTAATRDFLETLRVEPILGSLYASDEGDIGEQSIYLSEHIWERRFSSDPGIVGQTIPFYEQSWVVRGVMPRGFGYADGGNDYWIPLRQSQWLEARGTGFMSIVGRLAPGTSVEVAQQELLATNRAIEEEVSQQLRPVILRSVTDVEREPVRLMLLTFLGAVGFFLLVACGNVANLALARTESRRRELAVRLSLGASRHRLLRQILAESTTLALIGGTVGTIGAIAGVQGLLAMAPSEMPQRDAIAIDPTVAIFALVLSIGAGVLFGAVPGLRGARIAGSGSARSNSTDRRSRATHQVLAGAQIALAVILLSGSALLVRSFVALNAVDTGFDGPEHILAAEMGLGRADYATPEQVLAFHDQILRGAAAIPGVESVGLSSHLPFSGSRVQFYVVREGEAYSRATATMMGAEMTNGDYRASLGLPLLRGRDPEFDASGRSPTQEILINEVAADALWPGQDPIGRSFSFDVEEGQYSSAASYYTVAGVVPNVADGSLDSAAEPRAYYSFPDFLQLYQFISGRFFYLTVRASGDPFRIVEPLRQLVLGLDPNAPLRSVHSLEQLLRETTIPARFRTVTLTAFAVLAAIVALLGVYGVMAYGVAASVRDIGVRMALGARSTEVRGEVLRQAFGVVAIGGGIGLGVAAALGPVMEAMLFDISARDPATLGGVLLLVLFGSLAAAYLPAKRASRVDPIRVLRQE